MAKFKIGDKVEDRNGNRGKVYEIKPNGGVIVYFDDGTHDAFKPELLKKVSNAARTICTTNPIVAKALKADCACTLNAVITLEELLKKNQISMSDFKKMQDEMKRKGAKAVHFIKGKDGRTIFKVDGTTIGNSTVAEGKSATANADAMLEAHISPMQIDGQRIHVQKQIGSLAKDIEEAAGKLRKVDKSKCDNEDKQLLGMLEKGAKKYRAVEREFLNSTSCNARGEDYNGKEFEIKPGVKFTPRDDRNLVMKIGRIKKDPKWGYMVEPDIMKGENDWYALDEIVVKNSESAICNSADADKIVSIYRKELNKGGDTIKIDGEETMPNGMKRLTIKLFGKMHEDDRETPDVRIEKAIRSGERASYTVVGRGNRITNDGSFETTVRVMTNPKA